MVKFSTLIKRYSSVRPMIETVGTHEIRCDNFLVQMEFNRRGTPKSWVIRDKNGDVVDSVVTSSVRNKDWDNIGYIDVSTPLTERPRVSKHTVGRDPHRSTVMSLSHEQSRTLVLLLHNYGGVPSDMGKIPVDRIFRNTDVETILMPEYNLIVRREHWTPEDSDVDEFAGGSLPGEIAQFDTDTGADEEVDPNSIMEGKLVLDVVPRGPKYIVQAELIFSSSQDVRLPDGRSLVRVEERRYKALRCMVLNDEGSILNGRPSSSNLNLPTMLTLRMRHDRVGVGEIEPDETSELLDHYPNIVAEIVYRTMIVKSQVNERLSLIGYIVKQPLSRSVQCHTAEDTLTVGQQLYTQLGGETLRPDVRKEALKLFFGLE